MKKKILIVLALSALFLTGCGDSLYEMTDEEHDQVVSYAAHVINKFNIYQKDGMTYVSKKELDAANHKPEQEPESEKADQKEDATENSTEVEKGDNSSPPETEVTKPKYETVSLAEVIHNSAVGIQYSGKYLSDVFSDDVSYVAADKGKTFFVMEFKLSNTTKEAQLIDVDSSKPEFQVEFSNGKKVKVKTTILPQDLSTMNENLEANKETTCLLIFEMKKEDAESAGDFVLLYKSNDSTKQIALN